jgi:hypothetical protein
MNTSHNTLGSPVVDRGRSGSNLRRRWRRTLLASTAALSLAAQNTAWATCLSPDATGSTAFPAGGYLIGSAAVPLAADWSPNIFTIPEGSYFIPDSSITDQTAGAPTGGGHNWAFDQGSTLCKLGDAGSAAGTTAWILPPNTSPDCIVLPVIVNGLATNLGDIPFQGSAVTPTCDPTKLSTAAAPNPANTYFNQLGCAIAASNHGGVPVATDAHSATSYLFVAGIKGGMFTYELDNSGPIGKTVGARRYFSDIPEGLKLESAQVSPDGMFAVAVSNRRSSQEIWACVDPLGNPGDPAKPLDPGFAVPNASAVFCGGIGNTGLATNLATSFGPDNQPYFGGQRVVNTFLGTPGGAQGGAWPQCVHFGGAAPVDANKQPLTAQALHDVILADLKSSTYQKPNATIPGALMANTANKCGTATANAGFATTQITQPSSLLPHVAADGTGYMYTGPLGGTVVQFHLGEDNLGRTTYQSRTYLTGIGQSTGLGVADDLGSLMVVSIVPTVATVLVTAITKLPLCEDMN